MEEQDIIQELKDVAYQLRALGWFIDVAEMLAAERIIVLDRSGQLQSWTLEKAQLYLATLKTVTRGS